MMEDLVAREQIRWEHWVENIAPVMPAEWFNSDEAEWLYCKWLAEMAEIEAAFERKFFAEVA